MKEYEIINVKDVESENAYSVYVAKLLDAELNANIKDIKNILYEKLAEEGYTVDDEYKAFVENIGKWRYKELIQFDVRRFLKNKMIEATYISPRSICLVLMFLYPDPDELISTIQKLNKEPTFQEYKCDTCGKTYVTTPYSYKLIGCNNCNEKLSENEVMKNILSNEGYEMNDLFESMSKKLECIHDKCGDKVFIKPRSFIYEEVRCICEKNMTFAEAKKEIKSLGDYELLEYTSKDKVCKIHSGECGHTFDVRYRKFVKSPKCRICSPKTMTTDILSKRIKRQTNGEYELVGDFVSQDIKISILHKPCGVITEYNPRYFYCGAVCPVCNNVHNDKWRDMYELLCEYNNKFGHVNIPKREKYKGYELGVWCCRQRQNYKNNKLSQNRIELLENINFIFDILEAEWCRRYEQYKRYIKEKGSTYIARRTDYEGEHLGAWVETQKKRYKQGKISDNRVERLMLLDEKFFE